ncbi:hypothetical protein ACFJIS_12705 [Variovorax boronicumulans]|uniref:hypothetical protein n=1 Tax=Variovorax boronicumulans TaxID=436515 RepID=UPI0036F3BE57
MKIQRNAFLLSILSLSFIGDATSQSLCIDCISIRVGRPLVVRGPAASDLDTTFSQVKLSNNERRGFSGNATSNYATGLEPWSMGGATTPIPTLSSGTADGFSDCGRWLADTKRLPNNLINGFVHAETLCNYSVNQTRKSMAYSFSVDSGASWSAPQQIISGPDTFQWNKITGEGDCTVAEGGDSYYYAYCLRASDWRTIVARAPISSPQAGNWRKWFGGGWTEPGLGGNATALFTADTSAPGNATDGLVGTGSGRWADQNRMVLLASDSINYPPGQNNGFGGIKISFSSNKTNFTRLKEPLWVADYQQWDRTAVGAQSDLFAYLSILSNQDSSNQFTSPFLVTHTYLQPGEGFDKRYLVFRDVTMTVGTTPANPQVGVALTRWYNATTNDMRSTVAPVPGNFTSFAMEKSLGYLMTKAPSQFASSQLEECTSNWPGHPDNLLTNNGTCNGYTRLRTAGWVFQSPQANTIPLYRCFDNARVLHFASNQSDCEGRGTMEWLLGYALQY